MGGFVKQLFGGGGNQGPSAAEKELQKERMIDANRAEAENDQKVALAARAQSLRNSLSYRDRERKGTLGG
jgi:hypothetical protein